MTVWIVTIGYPDIDCVNDELDIMETDLYEIAGVFHEENDARKLQEELISYNAHEVISIGSDPIDVCVTEWRVQ